MKHLMIILIIIFMGAKEEAGSSKTNKKEFTYLALGDSYTIGESVTALENFPHQVVRLLKESGYEFQPPEIIAKTGWTTDELQEAIRKRDLQTKFDFVTLLIGVNNQYRGRTVENFKPEFENLLKQAIDFAGGNNNHVIVISIPDWGVTPFAKGRDREKVKNEIDEYNKNKKQITEKYNVHFIEITQGTREAASDLTLLANDGLHPSGKEYRRWAEKISQIILRNL